MVLAATLAFAIYTDAGNDFVASKTQEFVSSKIPGSLKINTLRHRDGLTFHAKNLKFFPPQREQPVIDLTGVRVTLSWNSLGQGWLIVPSASGDSGVVRLQMSPNDRTTLEETFSDSKPKSKGSSSSKPFGMHFKSLAVKKTKLRIDLDSFKFRARDISGDVEILRDPEAPGVVVTLSEVDGQHTHPEVIGNRFALRNLNGKIKGNQDEVIDLSGSAHSETNDLPFRLRYWKDPKKVVADINRDETSIAFDIASTIGDAFVLPDFVELNFVDGDS